MEDVEVHPESSSVMFSAESTGDAETSSKRARTGSSPESPSWNNETSGSEYSRPTLVHSQDRSNDHSHSSSHRSIDDDDLDRMKSALMKFEGTDVASLDPNATPTMRIQYISIRQYLELRIAGYSKMEASQIVAEKVYNKKGVGSYKAKRIRELAEDFMIHGLLAESKQGRHVKTSTIIHDPNVQGTLRDLLNQMPLEDRQPRVFAELLNGNLLKTIPNAPSTVSFETARRWMKFLGFFPNAQKLWFYRGAAGVPEAQISINIPHL